MLTGKEHSRPIKLHKCGRDCDGIACSRSGENMNAGQKGLRKMDNNESERIQKALCDDLIKRVPEELLRIRDELAQWADDRFVLTEAHDFMLSRLTISEIAERESTPDKTVTAQQVFVREIEKYGLKFFESMQYTEPPGDTYHKYESETDIDSSTNAVNAIAGVDSCSIWNTKNHIKVKNAPYSLITPAMIQQIAQKG